MVEAATRAGNDRRMGRGGALDGAPDPGHLPDQPAPARRPGSLPAYAVGAGGEVLEGVSQIDQTPITGEPLPVLKDSGDRVLAAHWAEPVPCAFASTPCGGGNTSLGCALLPPGV